MSTSTCTCAIALTPSTSAIAELYASAELTSLSCTIGRCRRRRHRTMIATNRQAATAAMAAADPATMAMSSSVEMNPCTLAMPLVMDFKDGVEGGKGGDGDAGD